MPIIKSAIKKVRKDKKRTLQNKAVLRKLKEALKNAKKGNFNISEVFSVIDRASKKGVIHKNKAARFKSAVSKMVKVEVVEKPEIKKRKVVKKLLKSS